MIRKNILSVLSIFLISSLLSGTAMAQQERSPFTNISFGLFLGWGDFIQVENYELFDEDITHFLIEVNGMEYKEIIKRSRDLYGRDGYKCRLAEHFVETMKALGVTIGNTVDLKLYKFNRGHEVFELKDVPVTVENLEDIQFETNFCL